MAQQYNKTKHPGVRYRIHNTRKHGIQYDKYFAIYFWANGKRHDEGLGWASQGWTVEKAAGELAKLKESHRTGQGPQTLSEKREVENVQREKRETLKKQSEKESVTFSEFYNNSYLPLLGNKAPGSVHAEKILFTKWIKPYIGNMPFKDIFPLHIEKIKKAMTDLKKAPRSIEYVFSTARQIWNQAKRDGLTDRDSPTKQVKKPKYDNKRTTFFTHEQADILLEKLKEKSTQVYHISLLSLHTGMRASEIFKLKWVDLNLEEGIINIKDAKSGSRPAFMTSEVKAMFEKIKSQNNFFNDLVFTSNAGDTIRQISKTFERVIDELGFNEGITDRRQRFTFHNLRHTYASWLVQQGTPLYTVQQLMGHKSIALTERYSHLAPDSLKAAVTAFEKNLRLKKQAKVKIIKLEK